MFYLKHEGKKLYIEDNVLTDCAGCGKEHPVDLWDVFESGGDLYSTYVYCHECTVKRARANPNDPVSKMILMEDV